MTPSDSNVSPWAILAPQACQPISCAGLRYAIPASGVLPPEVLTLVQVMLMSQCPGFGPMKAPIIDGQVWQVS